jgi:hypothetical protein
LTEHPDFSEARNRVLAGELSKKAGARALGVPRSTFRLALAREGGAPQPTQRLRLTTWKVVLGLVAATAVVIAANVRSAWGDWTAVATQAWVPAIALWLWHTMAAGRKPRGAPVDLREMWTWVRTEALGGGQADPPQVGGREERRGLPPGDGGPQEDLDREANRPARTPARAVVRQLLKRHSGALTPERVARRTGVSIPHARRLLREERQPRLVGEQPPFSSGGGPKEVRP